MNIPPGAIAAFHERQHPDGEHRIWTGWGDRTTPVLVHFRAFYPARRISWWLHYGAEPQGNVIAACGVRLCVAAECLTDEVTRQRERILWAALHGVELTGTCSAGHDRAVWGEWRSGRRQCRSCHEVARRIRRGLPPKPDLEALASCTNGETV